MIELEVKREWIIIKLIILIKRDETSHLRLHYQTEIHLQDSFSQVRLAEPHQSLGAKRRTD